MYLRGRENVLKRVLIHVGALNLSLVMRQQFGKGTPRGWQGLSAESLLVWRWRAVSTPSCKLRMVEVEASKVKASPTAVGGME